MSHRAPHLTHEVHATPAETLVAYRVEIDDMGCICFASSPAKARWMAVAAYWEAGYGRRGVWPRPSAYRRPHLDSHPAKDRDPGRCYAEDTL